jgi:uracil-DNA glycosylase
LVGSYSLDYLAKKEGWPRASMTERVRNYRAYLPQYFPLPHPSWRTGVWEKRNPWFAREVLPALRHAVAGAFAP